MTDLCESETGICVFGFLKSTLLWVVAARVHYPQFSLPKLYDKNQNLIIRSDPIRTESK